MGAGALLGALLPFVCEGAACKASCRACIQVVCECEDAATANNRSCHLPTAPLHFPAAEINSFCDQLIRLAAHQPAKGRTMSARKEFNHLMRSMPLRCKLRCF